MTQFDMIPKDVTFESEEDFNNWMQVNYPELFANRIPLNLTISFGNMSGEEAKNQYAPAFDSIASSLNTISGLSLDSATSFVNSFETVTDTTVTNLESIKTLLSELSEAGYEIDLTYNITGSAEQEGTYNISINDNGASVAIATLATSLATLTSTANTLAKEINNIEDRSEEVGNTADAIKELKDKSFAVNKTAAAIESLQSKTITASIVVKVTAPNPQPGSKTSSTISLSSYAKGNIALAKGGVGSSKTLMGELGPELVVSNGRYFTVGNNGAEFVDLPSDAIVFNHLQTKKLLGSGGMVGTGEPVTNERNAVALAGGNVTGPAMASAQDTLKELRALRSMWESLLSLSAKDFSRLGGSGGGSGGGGGASPENIKAYLHDLERWYNLLRQIAKTEQQISYEQARRQNLTSGYDYARSLSEENRLLQQQEANYRTLAEQQRTYYNQRREAFASTDYSMFFTFDENGLMQYQSGMVEHLAKLNETNANGQAVMNSTQQLAYLKNLGFDVSVLNTNADGTAAETDEDRMENFWNNLDGWREELDSLFDSSSEYAQQAEEAAAAIRENLQEYLNMQLSLEGKLLQAVIDREQAQIDALTKQREALEKANRAYIDGLNKALQKERELYQRNEDAAETSRLQRQLAILQRSGGSAAEIQSLQSQIDSRLQDAYFQEQQSQIDVIQEASDNQLEKMQTQIDLMTETLEYQKENGLLWEEIYTMMETYSPEELGAFIAENSKEFLASSPTEQAEKLKEIIFEAETLAERRAEEQRNSDWNTFFESLDYEDDFKEEHEAGAKQKYMDALADGKTKEEAEAEALAYLEEQEDSNSSNGSGNGNGGGNNTPPANPRIKFDQGSLKFNTYDSSDSTEPSGTFHGAGKSPVVEILDETDSRYKIKGTDGDGHTFNGAWISKKYKGNNIWKAYETGGLVDYTGPAWVDGTKTKPEAFLSADDTAMLKSKIFSNSDGSLKALVAALEQITNDTSKGAPGAQSSGESIIIQNAQVNIQPGVISNDYDAKKAGELALEEMIKIARKTTNRTVTR